MTLGFVILFVAALGPVAGIVAGLYLMVRLTRRGRDG